jgi:hypothetical protein
MKTLKVIIAVFATALVVSCGTYYRMTTTVDCKGKAHRDIYTFGNKTFMLGDISENPYLFDINPDWNLCRFDSITQYDFFGEVKDLNVKISKSLTFIENYSKEMSCDEEKKSLASPEESLVKKRGWFYTKFTFKAEYNKFQYETPVPIDKYLSKEEQILWTQGGLENYQIYSGSEMNEYLNDIGEKYLKWYSENIFEISLESIQKLTDKYDINVDKENIYNKVVEDVKGETSRIDPEIVCEVLNSFYNTTYFSKLYKANKERIENDYVAAFSGVKHVVDAISYELIIPGKILQTNSPIIHSDTLIWKVDGMRLLFDDYSLTAEYRVANRWTFVLTGLLIALAIGGFIIINIRDNKSRLIGNSWLREFF